MPDWAGSALQLEQAELTLAGLQRLWGRPVHLETREEGRGKLLSHDGAQSTQREITPSGPGGLAVGQGRPAAGA